MINIKEFKTWQWVFVAFLVIITLASIVAEFAGSHESHGTPGAETAEHATLHESHATVTQHSEGHSTHWWSGIPLFWIWFGALGCFVITIFAKKILGPVIYKKEDYYNE